MTTRMKPADAHPLEKRHMSVQAPVWLRVELEALAARNERSFSAEVRVALEAHVRHAHPVCKECGRQD